MRDWLKKRVARKASVGPSESSSLPVEPARTGRNPFSIEALEPRLLLSADPISGEFARMLEADAQDDGAETVAAIVHEIGMTEAVDSLDASGADSPAFDWPAGWNRTDDGLSDSGPVDLGATLRSLVQQAVANGTQGGDSASASGAAAGEESDDGAAAAASVSVSAGSFGDMSVAEPLLELLLDSIVDEFADAAIPADLTIRIGNLDGDALAVLDGNTVIVDIDAAGAGWTIDGGLAAVIADVLGGAAEAAGEVGAAPGLAPAGIDNRAEAPLAEASASAVTTTATVAGTPDLGPAQPAAGSGVAGATFGAAASDGPDAAPLTAVAFGASGATGEPANSAQGTTLAARAESGVEAATDNETNDGATAGSVLDSMLLGLAAVSLGTTSSRFSRSALSAAAADDTAGDHAASAGVTPATVSTAPGSTEPADDHEARGPPAIQLLTVHSEDSDSIASLDAVSTVAGEDAGPSGRPVSGDGLARAPPEGAALARAPPAESPTTDAAYSSSTGTPTSPSTVALTDPELAPIVTEAIARWNASGLLPVSAPDLTTLTFVIADLPGDALALQSGTTITIDIDADQFGWFVDPTPGDDSEFGGAPPAGIDLLTAVMHEIGHFVGFDHDFAGFDGLMDETLAPGVRHLPAFGDALPLNDVIDALLHIHFDPVANPNPAGVLQFTMSDAAVPETVVIGRSGTTTDLSLSGVTLTFSLMSWDSADGEWDGQVSVESPVAVLLPGRLDTVIIDDGYETPQRIIAAGPVTASGGSWSVEFTVSGDARDGSDILTAEGHDIGGFLSAPFTAGFSVGDEVAVINASSAGFNDLDLSDDTAQIVVTAVSYDAGDDETVVTVSYNFDPEAGGAWSGGGVIAEEDVDIDDDADVNALGGTIFLGDAAGIDVLNMNTLEATDLGLPLWLDVRVTALQMQFAEFRDSDLNSTLRLTGELLGINTGSEVINNLLRSGALGFGLNVEGSVEGLEFDMTRLRNLSRLADGTILIPEFPIVDITGITASVGGNLWGLGSIQGSLIIKSVMVDSTGAITTVDAPGNRTITYGAISGAINILEKTNDSGAVTREGFGASFNLAISELGPLQFFASYSFQTPRGPDGKPKAGLEGRPIGTTGLELLELRAGIRFNSSLEDLQVRPPFGATSGTVAPSGDLTKPFEVTLTVPGHNLAVGDEFRITAAGNPNYLSGAENFVVTAVNEDDISYLVQSDPGAFATTTDIKKISISDPTDLRDPGFLSTKDLSLADWEAQLDQQVVNQANGFSFEDGNLVSGGELIQSDVVDGHNVIFGKVDINDDGLINDDDDGTLLGFNVINGAIDQNGDDVIDSADDGVLPPASFWDVLFDDVVIEGGATVKLAGVPSALLNIEADLFIDSTGKFLLTGAANILNPESGFERGNFGVNVPARLFADFDADEVTILFLMDVPEVPANSGGVLPLVVFDGRVQFQTLVNGVAVADTDAVTGFPTGVGTEVTAATVTDISGTGFGPWEVSFTLDAGTNVADEFAVGDTLVVAGSDPDSFNGNHIVTAVDAGANSVSFVIGSVVIDGAIDVNNDGAIDSGDTGSVSMIPVVDGELDVDKNGVVDDNDDGEIFNIETDASGELIIVAYRVVNGRVDVDGDGVTAGDADDDLILGIDPGVWVGDAEVANENDLGNGVRISIDGGVSLNIPTVTSLRLGGSAQLDITTPGEGTDEDVRMDFAFDMSLEEENIGSIGRANGQFSVTMDTQGSDVIDGITLPKVEVWGAALLTTDFEFLEKYGIFAEVSGVLVFNNTTEDKAPIELINTAGETVTVDPTALTFALRLDGSVGLRIDHNDNDVFEESEQAFLIEGIAVLSFIAEEGFNVAIFAESGDPAEPIAPATLKIGPAGDPYLQFDVFGFLAIRSTGVAANMVLGLSASGQGSFFDQFNVDAQFVLMVNTTGTDVSFEVPGGADDPSRPSGLTINMPRAPPNSITDASLNIFDLLNGSAWDVDPGTIGAPYILIHLGGTDPATDPNAVLELGPFSLRGKFSFLAGATVDPTTLDVFPLLEISADIELDITIGGLQLFLLEGSGFLRFDQNGLLATLDLTQRIQTPSQVGFSLNTTYRLDLNTTGAPVDHDNNSLTPDIPLGFRLHMSGEMTIVNVLTIEGTFDLTIDNTGAFLAIDAHFDLLGVRADFNADATLTAQGFTLDATLTLSTGGLAVVPGLFNVQGTFRLTIDTITGFASIAVENANVNLLGLVMSGSILIGVDQGQFFINVPQNDPLSLNFFGVAQLQVHGSFNYDGNGGASGTNAFFFQASAQMEIGIPGVLGVRAELTLSFDSARGAFVGTIDGDAWIAGIRFGASATLKITGSSISLSLSIRVTITPSFTIWIPFVGKVRVPAVRLTYSHTFNIGTTTPPESFNVPDPDPPVLARVQGDTLFLNMGVDSALRDPEGDWDDEDPSESFRVTHVGGTAGNETLQVDAFGFQQEYSGIANIVVTDAADGDDVIDIAAGVLAGAQIRGGDDDDRITYLGSGQAILHGDAGNDTLQGGTGGTAGSPDELHGGPGDDRLEGGVGFTNVFGDGGDDTIVWNHAEGAVLGTIDGGAHAAGSDFGDTLQIIGGPDGETAVEGAAPGGDFSVLFGAGTATASAIEGLILDMQGGADSITINDLAGSPLENIIVRLGQNADGTSHDGAQDHVVINGTGADESFVLQQAETVPEDGGPAVVDTIGVRYTGGGSVVNVAIEQGFAAGGDRAAGDLLTINGNGGSDTVDAGAVTAALLNMRFSLGNAGTILGSDQPDIIEIAVGATPGTLNIDGRDGGDSYVVNLRGGDTDTEITIADTGATGVDTLLVNGTGGVDRFTISGTLIRQGVNSEDLNYSGLESFTVDTLGDDDEVVILSTHAGTAFVNAGDGDDTVAIRSIAGATDIDTGVGSDRVNVGSNADVDTNADGNLDGIAALLTLTGGPDGATDGDTLDIDDSGDGTADLGGVLTSVDLSGLGSAAGIDYDTFEDLRIQLGSGDDEFLVTSTHGGLTTIDGNAGDDEFDVLATAAGSTTTLNGLAGDDVFDIGNAGDVGAIAGLVVIDGGLDDDDINVDASASTADEVAVLTSDMLRGMSLGVGIDYDEAESFDVWLGTGTDTFYVESTHAGSTTAYTGEGGDTIAIRSIGGTTTIRGQGGGDSMLVNVQPGSGGPPLYGLTAANDDQFVRTHENGLDGAAGANVLNLHGEGGGDTYVLNLAGEGEALIVVDDQGDAAAGVDTLTINGADAATPNPSADDTFLLRRDFVALLNTLDPVTGDHTLAERVNYDGQIDGLLTVNGLAGDDDFHSDDNSAETVLNGGADNDTFQVGQIFSSPRDAAAQVAPGDEFDTTAVFVGENEVGYLSDGVTFDTTIRGGDGDDVFSVYRNVGELILEGEAGDDQFVVRAFATVDAGAAQQGDATINGGGDADTIQYAINAPVTIDGGDGFDTVLVIGTLFDDVFVVTDAGIFGAGLNVAYEGVESATLDALEGDDRIFVLSTAAGVVTTVIGGVGSDEITVGGDVDPLAVVISDDGDGDDTMDFDTAPQDLASIKGPLIVEGGVGDALSQALRRAVVFPGELNGESGTGNVPSEEDELDAIDVLNIFHADNGNAETGRLLDRPASGGGAVENAGVALTGLGMSDDLVVGPTGDEKTYGGGITMGDFEIVEILLGTGNETLTVDATLDDAITVIHGGGGNDTLTINDRGDGPLIVYGDTSEDRARYSNDDPDPAVASVHAAAFTNDGNDTIDASQMAEQHDGYVGVVIYGGFGTDTIDGSQDDDHIAGGSGRDTIRAQAGNDQVYGDSHFNVNPLLHAQDRVSAFASDDPRIAQMFEVLTTTAGESAGVDTIFGGADSDIVFGDHGVVSLGEGTRRLATTGSVLSVVSAANWNDGAGDTLRGGDDPSGAASGSDGNDLLIGGVGRDTISGDAGSDLIFGDHGSVEAAAGGTIDLGTIGQAGGFHTDDALPHNAIYRSIFIGVAGGDDTLHAGSVAAANDTDTGNDIVLGQQGGDTIFGSGGDDDIYGGHNVAGGDDGGDTIDAGAGRDVVVGDNGVIERTASADNPRFAVLEGSALYGADWQPDIANTVAADPSGTPARDILLLDHSDTTNAGLYGADTIAGGADDDQLFGQLGDDSLHGDGTIVNGQLAALSSTIAGSDVGGDDYVEGNGGGDEIYGGAGQDDIIGGSSSLYGLTTPAQRPDGSDTIFGGNGDLTGRNDTGAGLTDESGQSPIPENERHARDADVIIGDNGEVQRLVGTNGVDSGALLRFDYDTYDATRRTVVRGATLLDYTPGGPEFSPAANQDRGAADTIHGEAGDDTAYGMVGDDILFGDAQSDDLIGGYGNDWISGGTDSDGVLGDDGRILTSRNTADPGDGSQFAESLYGIGFVEVDRNEQTLEIATPGDIQQAFINELGALKKTVALVPFNVQGGPLQDPLYRALAADDIIYGGLGDDFLHGGSGNDAISGAEALPAFYNNPSPEYDVLGFSDETLEFEAFDEFDPRSEIAGFLLNFDPTEGAATGESGPGGAIRSDGNDRIFGDLGNDWLVGGTGNDHIYGGWGIDLINADDDHRTNGGSNDVPDTAASYEDIAFGGAGRDILIANTGGDRLIDWAGAFNTYLVPFAPFGAFTISRSLQPGLFEFLYDLSEADGADPFRNGDPLRNGEPDGEIGLVMQKDFAWQDQTGAPDNINPGNIPGGERDVIRGADFNTAGATDEDGRVNGFAADSGSWTVEAGRLEVSPAARGLDAVSVFYVDEVLPSYFEISATINADKPTGGSKSNAYLIFDYQSPTDFKFAGIDISTDKLVMGRRTEAGWIIDVQTNARLRPDVDYNLLLSINGSVATLVVDNTEVFTHVFETRTDVYGVVHGLNGGMVGLGADNSTARIDNLRVQVLQPETTLEATETFANGGGAVAFDAGDWTVASGALVGAGAATGNQATIDFDVRAAYLLRVESTLETSGSAGLFFDRNGEDNYKFAVISAATNEVLIGHYTANRGIEIDVAVPFAISGSESHQIEVTLSGTTVSVVVDGNTLAGYAFNASVVDGEFGLLALEGTVSVDAVTWLTDDPQYLPESGEALLAGGDAQTVPQDAVKDALTPIQLMTVVDQVLDGWLGEGTIDADQYRLLSQTRFRLIDLPDRMLGLATDDAIYIDYTGAGFGWHVGAGHGPGGRMDLATAVAHELGHRLGFGHGEGPLMAETLDPGQRGTAFSLPVDEHAASAATSEAALAGTLAAMAGSAGSLAFLAGTDATSAGVAASGVEAIEAAGAAPDAALMAAADNAPDAALHAVDGLPAAGTAAMSIPEHVVTITSTVVTWIESGVGVPSDQATALRSTLSGPSDVPAALAGPSSVGQHQAAGSAPVIGGAAAAWLPVMAGMVVIRGAFDPRGRSREDLSSGA